jgi:predicted lipid carrier protein YhbT
MDTTFRPGWRRQRRPGPHGALAERIRTATLLPLGAGLTLSLNRVLRRNPGLSDRLEAAHGTTILVQPRELPVGFLIRLERTSGRVTAVPRGTDARADVGVEAPLAQLLTIFRGEDDGDAAFFSSDLTIDGEVAPLLALRNAIEAAELDWADLSPLPVPRGLPRPPGLPALMRRLA